MLKLSKDMKLSIFNYLDIQSLKSLTYSSKTLYLFCQQIWKLHCPNIDYIEEPRWIKVYFNKVKIDHVLSKFSDIAPSDYLKFDTEYTLNLYEVMDAGNFECISGKYLSYNFSFMSDYRCYHNIYCHSKNYDNFIVDIRKFIRYRLDYTTLNSIMLEHNFPRANCWHPHEHLTTSYKKSKRTAILMESTFSLRLYLKQEKIGYILGIRFKLYIKDKHLWVEADNPNFDQLVKRLKLIFTKEYTKSILNW